MTSSVWTTTTPHTIPRPAELVHRPFGDYVIHYYGDECGVVAQWDGTSSAADLAEQDEQEARDAGAADEDGSVARIEVLIIRVGATRDCVLDCVQLDRAVIG